MSLIRNRFHDPQQRQFAIGVWIAAFSLGSAIGSLVGALLLEYCHRGAVLPAAVPLMSLVLLLRPWLLPEYRDPVAGRIDAVSAVLSLAAVLVTVFVRRQRQRQRAHPLLDLTLFGVPRFRAALVAHDLSCLAMFGSCIFITQYLQEVLALSPLRAGLATLPWALAFVLGSLVAPALARRVAPGGVRVWGLAAAALGFAGLVAAEGRWAIPVLVLAPIVMSLGMAPKFTHGNEMIITAAPPGRAGAASALPEAVSAFSGGLGVALFGSLGAEPAGRGGSGSDHRCGQRLHHRDAGLGRRRCAAGGGSQPAGRHDAQAASRPLNSGSCRVRGR